VAWTWVSSNRQEPATENTNQEVVDNVTCEEEAIDCTSIPVIDFVLLFDYMTHLLTIEGDFMVM